MDKAENVFANPRNLDEISALQDRHAQRMTEYVSSSVGFSPNLANSVQKSEYPLEAVVNANDLTHELVDRIFKLADKLVGPAPKEDRGHINQEPEGGILGALAYGANFTSSRIRIAIDRLDDIERKLP